MYYWIYFYFDIDEIQRVFEFVNSINRRFEKYFWQEVDEVVFFEIEEKYFDRETKIFNKKELKKDLPFFNLFFWEFFSNELQICKDWTFYIWVSFWWIHYDKKYQRPDQSYDEYLYELELRGKKMVEEVFDYVKFLWWVSTIEFWEYSTFKALKKDKKFFNFKFMNNNWKLEITDWIYDFWWYKKWF